MSWERGVSHSNPHLSVSGALQILLYDSGVFSQGSSAEGWLEIPEPYREGAQAPR